MTIYRKNLGGRGTGTGTGTGTGATIGAEDTCKIKGGYWNSIDSVCYETVEALTIEESCALISNSAMYNGICVQKVSGIGEQYCNSADDYWDGTQCIAQITASNEVECTAAGAGYISDKYVWLAGRCVIDREAPDFNTACANQNGYSDGTECFAVIPSIADEVACNDVEGKWDNTNNKCFKTIDLLGAGLTQEQLNTLAKVEPNKQAIAAQDTRIDDNRTDIDGAAIKIADNLTVAGNNAIDIRLNADGIEANVQSIDSLSLSVNSSLSSISSLDQTLTTVYNALNTSKADVGHNHSISDVSGLQADLDDKQAQLATKAHNNHGHTISDVSSLQNELDSKAPISHGHAKITANEVAIAANTQAIANLPASSSGLTQDQLDTLAKVDGNEADIADSVVQIETNMQNITTNTQAITTKANSSHNHNIADVSGLQADLDDKQAQLGTKAHTNHGHTISDVSGLQADLDDKQSQLNGMASNNHSHLQIETNKTNIEANTQAIANLPASSSGLTQDQLDTLAKVDGNEADIATNTQAIANLPASSSGLTQAQLEAIAQVDVNTSAISVNANSITDKADIVHDHANFAQGINDNANAINLNSSAIVGKAPIGHNHSQIEINKGNIITNTAAIAANTQAIDDLPISSGELTQAQKDTLAQVDVNKISIETNTTNINRNSTAIDEAFVEINLNSSVIVTKADSNHSHAQTNVNTAAIAANTQAITNLPAGNKSPLEIYFTSEQFVLDADAGDFPTHEAQGWATDQSDVVLTTYKSRNVFQVPDNGSDLYNVDKSLTLETFNNLHRYDGIYYGTIALDSTNGYEGGVMILEIADSTQVTALDGTIPNITQNTVGFGSRMRLKLLADNSTGIISIICPGIDTGNTTALDGTTTASIINPEGSNEDITYPLTKFDDFIDFEIHFKGGLDNTKYLYINGQLIGNPAFEAGLQVSNYRLLYTSGSGAGVDRISYVNKFGLSVNTNPSEFNVTKSEMEASSGANIILPKGSRDYKMIFDRGINVPLGYELNLLSETKGALEWASNENTNGLATTINGYSEGVLELDGLSITKRTNVSLDSKFIGSGLGTKQYSYFPITAEMKGTVEDGVGKGFSFGDGLKSYQNAVEMPFDCILARIDCKVFGGSGIAALSMSYKKDDDTGRTIISVNADKPTPDGQFKGSILLNNKIAKGNNISFVVYTDDSAATGATITAWFKREVIFE